MKKIGIYKGLSRREQDQLEEVARDMGMGISETVDALVGRFEQMFPDAREVIRNEALRNGDVEALNFKSFDFDRTGA
jgi:hypothetical protein